jgi:hypothetical protein
MEGARLKVRVSCEPDGQILLQQLLAGLPTQGTAAASATAAAKRPDNA